MTLHQFYKLLALILRPAYAIALITKNIHAYRTTPKGKKIDMRKTKINFRNLFDNNLDEAIYMVKVFSRVELDQLLNTAGHMRKARRFISRLFTILNGYKYVNEDFSKDIETSGLLEAYEIYQDILNIEKTTLKSISYNQGLRDRVIELLSLNLDPDEKIEDYTNNPDLECTDLFGQLETKIELGGGSSVNSRESTIKKLNKKINLLEHFIFDLMWDCFVQFGIHNSYISKYPKTKVMSNRKFLKLVEQSYINQDRPCLITPARP